MEVFLTTYSIVGNRLLFKSTGGVLSLLFLHDECVKISYYIEREYENPCIEQQGVSLESVLIKEQESAFHVVRNGMEIIIEKTTRQLAISCNEKTITVKDYTLFDKQIRGKDVKGSRIVFGATKEEAFYGLGQQQSGNMNYAGKTIEVWHNYKAKDGETVGIPFLVSSRCYGIIMNTLSQSTVHFDNETIQWETDCVQDLSFILMLPKDYAGLYQLHRLLCGQIPMPLKASLGYIQCKQRYKNQEEITKVAKTHQEKGYPIDMLVVDWFHWQALGDMSLNKTDWPDPSAMTKTFDLQNIDTMISVWPRFMKESQYYSQLEKKGFFMTDDNGDVVYGTPEDQRGALIDTTNPDCQEWFSQTIVQNYASQGFRAWWLDENEPDLWPYDYSFHAGKGYEIFNYYPYTHTKCVYEKHREALSTRACILSRSGFLGSQQFGTQFWSSDIYPTWGVLEKQVPTAINFCATGMGYWSSDIGGWQPLPDYHDKEATETAALLLETQGSSHGVVTSKEYSELYIRWFQFGAFCPIFRTHGTRDENEVWSYGEEAEKILVKYLNLRYQFMPYIYSHAYQMHKTGEPLLRGLFLDYGHDETVHSIKDQYLLGKNLLVAPVVEQHATTRKVYLPKGNGWYDYWTNVYYQGGQTIVVDTPLDTIALFVKENSILPLGSPVLNTKETQNITYTVYGNAPCECTCYEDDGRTYAYEKGTFTLHHAKFANGVLLVDGDAVECKIIH